MASTSDGLQPMWLKTSLDFETIAVFLLFFFLSSFEHLLKVGKSSREKLQLLKGKEDFGHENQTRSHKFDFQVHGLVLLPRAGSLEFFIEGRTSLEEKCMENSFQMCKYFQFRK